jgi:anti-sigma-K factor RskA
MQCEKFQELILTDYLDDELNVLQHQEIESHLAACPHCRAFAQNAKIALVDPFDQLERIEPSVRVWKNIKEAIGKDANPAVREDPFDLWETLRRLFPLPRPVLVMATFAVMAVMVLTVFLKQNNQTLVVQVEEEQATYLAYLMEDIGSADADENGGYGTAIEEYFL